jgi:hypothetical protein
MSLLDTASLVVTPNGTKASKLYSVVPSSGTGDLDVTRATTATRVNSSGLIESVASNVPRLDYTNGTCPSILVEPQRTNLHLYSEQFENTWLYAGSNVVTNTTISPDGNLTADTINKDVSSGHIFKVSGDGSFGDTQTFSAYYKGVAGETIVMNFLQGGGGTDAQKTITFTGSWQRESITFVRGNFYNIYYLADWRQGGNATSFQSWGAQLEAGSYATSYIPTTSASVTRNADVISKTGISSLIGQTEGTMFVDIDFDGTGYGITQDFLLYIGSGSYTNSIWIDYYNNNFRFYIYSGTSELFVFTTPATNGRKKLAFGYKSGQYVAYINGTLVNSSTDTTNPPTCSMVSISEVISNDRLTKNFNTAALWKTRLTNSQLQTLTTI